MFTARIARWLAQDADDAPIASTPSKPGVSPSGSTIGAFRPV